MNLDPIVEEIHGIRAKLSQEYGDDLHAICEAFRREQGANQRPLISRPPKPVLHNVHAEPNPSIQQNAFQHH